MRQISYSVYIEVAMAVGADDQRQQLVGEVEGHGPNSRGVSRGSRR